MRPNASTASPTAARRTAWVVLLAAASVLASFALACATPFPALAALAALHLRRNEAMGLVALAWLANQVIGYGFLHYPVTWDSMAWGGLISVAAFAAFAAASFPSRQGMGRFAGVMPGIALSAGVFAAAFATYEAVLFAATAFLPAEDYAFSFATVLLLLKINAVAFAGLWLLQQAGERLGLAAPRAGTGLSQAS